MFFSKLSIVILGDDATCQKLITSRKKESFKFIDKTIIVQIACNANILRTKKRYETRGTKTILDILNFDVSSFHLIDNYFFAKLYIVIIHKDDEMLHYL